VNTDEEDPFFFSFAHHIYSSASKIAEKDSSNNSENNCLFLELSRENSQVK
jgi:hypothetical protein